MTDDGRLRNSITAQADDLKRRVGWIQNMLDRQTQAILNAQETIEHFRTDLLAVNMALDGLRAEYRKLIEEVKP